VAQTGHETAHRSTADFDRAVTAARGADEVARGELLESCRRYLLAIAQSEMNKNLRAKVGSSDIVQETIIKAHAKFNTFRGGTKEELLGWLRQILLNDLADTRRAYQGTRKRAVDREAHLGGGSRVHPAVDVLQDSAPTPGAAAAMGEELARLRSELAKLTAENRQVIPLRNWQRLTFSEIGKRMNRSEEAARKLWARAITRLQTAMEVDDDSA